MLSALPSIENYLTEAIIVGATDPATKVVGLLKEKNAYEVFVEEKERTASVSILNLLNTTNLQSTKVQTLMYYVPRLAPTDHMVKAAKLMAEHRLRALPVYKNKDLIGVIRVNKVMEVIAKTSLGRLAVSKIMTPQPVTITPEDHVDKIRLTMLRRRFDHLPVIDGRRIVGIVTSSMIVFHMLPYKPPDKFTMGAPDIQPLLRVPAKAMMEANPILINPQTTLGNTADIIEKQGSTYALVTVEEELQGIVTLRDFAKLIAGLPHEKEQPPVYIIGLPNDPFEAEAAKTKFSRLISLLRRALPDMIEARSTIKTSKATSAGKNRYEVTVSIYTSRRMHNYFASGWDLASVYDEIQNKVKRIVAQKPSRRKLIDRDLVP